MILVCEYYISDNQARNREILECLLINLTVFHEVHILCETQVSGVIHPRLVEVVINKRLTFKTLFEYVNSLGTQDLVVISNNDISFEKTNWEYAYELVEDKKYVVTLTRWNLTRYLHGGTWNDMLKITDGEGSQDCWMFKGKLDVDLEEFNHTLGTSGCDCKLNRHLTHKGYKLINPVHQLVTVHRHTSDHRVVTPSIDQEFLVPFAKLI